MEQQCQKSYSVLTAQLLGFHAVPKLQMDGELLDLVTQESHGKTSLQPLSSQNRGCQKSRALSEQLAICSPQSFVFQGNLSSSRAVEHHYQELRWSFTGCWGFLSQNFLIKQKARSCRRGLETKKLLKWERARTSETQSRWQKRIKNPAK